jgi:hypothetical protein
LFYTADAEEFNKCDYTVLQRQTFYEYDPRFFVKFEKLQVSVGKGFPISAAGGVSRRLSAGNGCIDCSDKCPRFF